MALLDRCGRPGMVFGDLGSREENSGGRMPRRWEAASTGAASAAARLSKDSPGHAFKVALLTRTRQNAVSSASRR
jgi:hypothetical protein